MRTWDSRDQLWLSTLDKISKNLKKKISDATTKFYTNSIVVYTNNANGMAATY